MECPDFILVGKVNLRQLTYIATTTSGQQSINNISRSDKRQQERQKQKQETEAKAQAAQAAQAQEREEEKGEGGGK